ncbi:IS66 family transposase [Rhodobacter sp. NSM]|uniref:IS66 family transposase n=1 Tax=Rhodobacter sp. NSM TaxID=3457501 RepID=UPI003FD138F5
MAVAWFADHLPLYRQRQTIARRGVGTDRSTLADWMVKVSFHLAPIVARMAEVLRLSGQLFADAPRGRQWRRASPKDTMPALDPGARKTKKGFIWATLRDDRPWGGSDLSGVVRYVPRTSGGASLTRLRPRPRRHPRRREAEGLRWHTASGWQPGLQPPHRRPPG